MNEEEIKMKCIKRYNEMLAVLCLLLEHTTSAMVITTILSYISMAIFQCADALMCFRYNSATIYFRYNSYISRSRMNILRVGKQNKIEFRIKIKWEEKTERSFKTIH